MKIYVLSIFTFLMLDIPLLMAAPSGEDLLNACEAAMKENSSGLDAKMCDWYVTPCDCSVDPEMKLPRVCLADDFSTRELAGQVIDGLRKQPALLKEDAGMAASTILSKLYPCADGQP